MLHRLYLFCVTQQEEVTKTVCTTNTEVINTTTTTDGMVSQMEEIVETTTIEKKTTKLTTSSMVDDGISTEEHSSTDRSDNSCAQKNAEGDLGQQNSVEETGAETGIQSLLPNVKKTILTADGKVVTPSGQTLLHGTGNKTLMVLNKDGTKTLMRVIRPSTDEDTVMSSSNSSSTEDSNTGISYVCVFCWMSWER